MPIISAFGYRSYGIFLIARLIAVTYHCPINLKSPSIYRGGSVKLNQQNENRIRSNCI